MQTNESWDPYLLYTVENTNSIYLIQRGKWLKIWLLMINRKYFSWEITKVLVVNQATMGLSLSSWQIANAIRLTLIYKEKLCSRLAENLKLWIREAVSIEGVYVPRMQSHAYLRV